MISAGWVETKSATFAVSMLDPPPTPTNPSNSPSTAKSAAACSDSAVGSTWTSSNRIVSIPSASMRSRTLSVMPVLITPGSETTMTRRAPSRLSSQPVSAEAPRPNLIGVASMVKIVSWRGAPLPAVMALLSPDLRDRYPGGGAGNPTGQPAKRCRHKRHGRPRLRASSSS